MRYTSLALNNTQSTFPPQIMNPCRLLHPSHHTNFYVNLDKQIHIVISTLGEQKCFYNKGGFSFIMYMCIFIFFTMFSLFILYKIIFFFENFLSKFVYIVYDNCTLHVLHLLFCIDRPFHDFLN